jgi:hypothetical protein
MVSGYPDDDPVSVNGPVRLIFRDAENGLPKPKMRLTVRAIAPDGSEAQGSVWVRRASLQSSTKEYGISWPRDFPGTRRTRGTYTLVWQTASGLQLACAGFLVR